MFACYHRFMNWKGLLGGIVIIVLVGIAGLVYRNATEQKGPTGACTLEAKLCPDGSGVGRVGPSCAFAPCPFPNVDLTAAGIIYALPQGFDVSTLSYSYDSATLAVYAKGQEASGQTAELLVREYSIPAGKTGLNVMYETAIQDASGAPASPAAFSAAVLGEHTFSIVLLGRFEGVVDQAYYLIRQNDVLRFDAIDRGVASWTDPNLSVASLPANQALRALLTTLTND